MPKKPNKLLVILAVIIILAVFVPWHQARAEWYDPSTWVGSLFEFGTEMVSATVGELVMTVLALFNGIIASAISWSANLLDGFISFQTDNAIYNITVVTESWTIIRNFVNLLFILVLIIMAFGTIFDIQRYTWKNMLAPFLIAALLINFSLTIGQYIITVANGLSKVFLTEIQRAAAGGISATFAQGADIVKGVSVTATGTGAAFVQGVFSIVFLSIFLLALLVTALFSLARMFMLWFLLIISPIAWFGYTMPNLRSGTWSAWWKHFLCWCFWLPYFLFFVMFAVIFINSKGTLPMPQTQSFMSGVGNSVAFFALSIIFLIGGMGMARKLACASGTGVKAVFGKIETGVRKYAPGAAYVRATYAGAKEGLKERGKEIEERGLFGIGGAQKEQLRAAETKGWVAGIPGPGRVPGAREEAYRAQAAEVDKEVKRLQTLNLTLDQLNERLTKGGVPEKLAALKLKSENEWLDEKDADIIADTMRSAGGGRTAMGVSLIQSLRKGHFHEMAKDTSSKERIFNKFLQEDQELAKAFGTNMAESRELLNDKLASTLLDLYKSDAGEAKRKIEELVKKNIENFARKKEDRKAFLLNTDADKRIRKMVGQIMIDKKEINDLQSRQAAVDFIGKDTTEGREAIRNIGAFNSLLNIEAKLREERGIPIEQPLSQADSERILNELKEKLQEKLVKNELKEIKMMSPDFFKDPRFKEAAEEVFADPADMTRLLKDAPKDMRIALKDFARATKEPKTIPKPPEPEKERSQIVVPPVITGRGEEVQKSREEILRELGKIP